MSSIMKLFLLIFIFSIASAEAQYSSLSQLNFSHFTTVERKNVDEVLMLISPNYKNHPDVGVLPIKSQKKNEYVELVDKREACSSYFVERGTNGSHFILQQSYTPLNYKDANGWWREINPRLKQNISPLVFNADQQRFPAIIDLNKKNVAIVNGSKNISFGNDIHLIHKSSSGIETDFGSGNYSNFTAGDDGIYITDFYPKIDLVFIVKESKVEINFVLQKNIGFIDGELIMKQRFQLADGLSCSKINQPKVQEQLIVNQNGDVCYSIDRCLAYSNEQEKYPLAIKSMFDENNILSVFTPVEFLNNAKTIYPVVIDPIVTTVDSLLASAIMGTKFSAVCWTNSCDYNLAVPTPANSTVTTIYNSFGYQAIATCQGMDGGYSVDLAGCHWPSGAPGIFNCNFPIPMFTCILDTNPVAEFIPCFPAPSCAPQNLNFTLHFYRCNHDPDVNCLGNCIRAAENWRVEIEGRTLELNYFTPNTQVCGGANVNLIASAQYGVPPYSYSWSGSAINNDTILTTANVTTPYSCVVTDQCGNTVSGNDTIFVEPNNNPGFTISPITACVNTPINLSGNGVGVFTNYDWLVPGSNIPLGIISDNQNPAIQYSLAGNYFVTLRYYNSNCSYFDSTLTINVTSLSVPDVLLATNSVGPYCQGDTLHFSAAPVNGGSNPQYDWIVDGVLSQTGSVDTFFTDLLHNGSIVQVVLHSNSACVTTSTDTASTFIAINSAVTTSVIISPDTSVCPNSPVTFQAMSLNEGTTPQYQWFVNGVAVPGATTSSFNSLIGPNDSLISVQLQSSLRCVVNPIATDTSHVLLLQNLTPAVAVSSDANVGTCQGDSVHFVASPTFGGNTPTFEWFLNGVSTGIASSDSTFTFPANISRDSVSIRLVSSLVCLSNTVATNYSFIQATPSVVPSVSISSFPIIVCEGQPLSFTAQSSNGGVSPVYTWTVNGNAVDTGITFNAGVLPNSDTVAIIMNSSIQCANPPQVSSQFIVNNLITPAANFTYENPYPGSFLNLINFTNTSVDANSFVWYFALDSDTTFVTNPVHQFPGLGSYDVTLYAINSNGCIDSVKYTVVVQEQLAVFLPKAFSPNGDNINETFAPIGASLTTYKLFIYNRWGELIFEGNEKKPWSGLVRDTATPAHDGVYVYRLETNDLDLDEKLMNGRVTLIR